MSGITGGLPAVQARVGAVPVGASFGQFTVSVALLALIDPATNTKGIIVRTITARVAAGQTSQASYTNNVGAAQGAIFSLDGGASIVSITDSRQIYLPPGKGLSATASAASAATYFLTWDIL